MPGNADTIELLLAERDICRVMTLYCRGADRTDFALLRRLFEDDAHVDFGRFEGGPDDFIAEVRAAPAAGSMQHHLSNILVAVDGDRAEAETYCIARLGGLPSDGGAEDATAYVRYLNAFTRRDGEWRISRHLVVWDWNQHVPTTVRWGDDLQHRQEERSRRDRSDASYQFPLIAGL